MAYDASVNSLIIETIIGADTVFKGNISTAKPIRIDGVYEGEIVSEDIIIITETGKFNGTLKCRELQIAGCGEGSATCTELMEFAPTGKFKGDITTKNIVTCKETVIDGTLTMGTLR